MQSSIIGKIEKARRYAEEPERVKFIEFSANFRGDDNTYVTGFDEGKWHCTCEFFHRWGMCSHTMAMEKILGEMLPEAAITGVLVRT